MTIYEQMSAWHARVQALAKAKPYTPGEERTRTDGSVWKKPEDGGDLVMVRGPTSRGGKYGAPIPHPQRRNESVHGWGRLRTDGWKTTARWGAGHQDWPDDDPSAPWNEPIRWTSQQNDGAFWHPSSYYHEKDRPDLIVFRMGRENRHRGVYEVAPMVSPGSLSDTGYLMGAELVPAPGFKFNNLREVREHLRDHWRLNHQSDGMALARSLREQDAAAAKDRAAEAERARQREEAARHADWFKRDQAAKADRITADRASGRWMETGHDHHMHRLKPVQRTALLESLRSEGLGLADSWDVHDYAVVKRSATGGTWPDAYRFAAMKVRYLREA